MKKILLINKNNFTQEFFEPSNSVWINASAGNGKTKILTDRVLRLILNSANFSRILCITFTKNAALEIEQRILSKILQWSKQELDDIRLDIKKIYGYSPSSNELNRAKNLYSQYLRTPDKLNIQTIHSFCQKLLTLFSIETKISNNFRLISEYQKAEIISQVKKELILSNMSENIYQYIFEHISEFQVNNFLAEILKKRHLLQIGYIDSSENVLQLLQKKREIQKMYRLQCQNILDNDILHKYIKRLDIENLRSFFLTKLNTPKSFMLKRFHHDRSDLQKLQREFIKLEEEKANKQLILHSEIMSKFVFSFLKLYEEKKQLLGILDYEDLIIKTLELLKIDNINSWISYKLDHLIDHVLVDEAQDTNPIQWQIIDNIIQEFYLNYNTSDDSKSVFIVGDIKQSIFSFQSADLRYYLSFIKKLEQNFTKANYKFISQELFISYRSAKEINEFVHVVFSYIANKYPEIAIPISPIKTQQPFKGKIEIWPLSKNTEKKITPWPVINSENLDDFIEQKFLNLADDICDFVEDKLNSKYILQSQKREVRESDFLILCRKRSKLTELLHSRFIKRGIKLSSFGRIYVKENIICQDFIAIAKFILNPYDDLNLASVLRSPLIGISEENLQKLIFFNTAQLDLWDFIKNHVECDLEILKLKNTIYEKLSNIQKEYKICSLDNICMFLADIVSLRTIYYKIFDCAKVDIIMNELIALNGEYIENHDTTLIQFINWIENNNIRLNIEDTIENTVKLMTIHASKGLEAPIVILCDANNVPQNNQMYFVTDEGKLRMKDKSVNSDISSIYRALKDHEKTLALQEYIRLLYVALTRASEYLVICDVENNINSQISWINLIKSSINNLHFKYDEEKIILEEQEKIIPDTDYE